MAAPGFYNAADQALYDQGNYFLPQEQYRLNLGTDTGAPNRVEFNPSQEGIGSLQQSYPFPYYGEEGDDDDGDKGLPPGPKGVGSLMDRYNKAGYFGRSLVNMPIGMLAPPLAPALAMYNMGRSVYDFGRNVLGYNKAATNMRYDFDGNIADARSGSYSTNPGIGFSNRDLEDTNPNLGNNDGPDTSNMDAQGNYSDPMSEDTE
tara:strand:- start:452 stop:1063 length:612 start_codon:yes stop_codon:yes gene_type:complete